MPVSNVAVAVSVVGGGVAIERRSDARGRVTIESVPHGVIALDCVTTVDGRHFYGQATVQHSRPQSITLVLRHARDVENQVAAEPVNTRRLTREGRTEQRRDLTRLARRQGRGGRQVARGLYTAQSDEHPHPDDDSRRNRTCRRHHGTSGHARRRQGHRARVFELRGRHHRRCERHRSAVALRRCLVGGRAGRRERRAALLRPAERPLAVERNPIWQQKTGYISTDLMLEAIDVSALARDADLRLTLVGTTVNTRDGHVPTMIYAALGTVWPTSVGR